MDPERGALVAVVDDEEGLRQTVSVALRREGLAVETYADGMAAWNAFQEALPDVIVLDIMMPRMDGLELCRRIRVASETVPIIFLSSRDEELDRVLGLELGADDYLCKPFSMRELVARVRVLLRRAALLRRGVLPVEDEILRAGGLELDTVRYTVRLNERPVALTVTEFLMLKALVQRPGHVKTRSQLMDEGYPHDAFVSERTIDTHIKRLRKKLTSVDPEFDGIETVYGLGYRFRER